MDNYSPERNIHNVGYSLSKLKQAVEDKTILECVVSKCDKKYTLILNLGDDITGYIGIDELELIESDNKQAAAISKVGRAVKFIAIDITDTDRGIAVKCSRRLAQKDCYDNYISKLRPGDVVDAQALKYETYGIFCDIGCGIVALLPTGKIRVPYIVDPIKENKRIKSLYTIISKIHEDGKIELSHRELLGTWDDGIKSITKGEIRLGKVIGIQNYGYFVMISQNIHGLAEMTDKDIKLGDTVSVKVLHIIKSTKKVKLQMIDKVENQPIFDKYEYMITDGHIDKWEYFEGSDKTTQFSS